MKKGLFTKLGVSALALASMFTFAGCGADDKGNVDPYKNKTFVEVSTLAQFQDAIAAQTDADTTNDKDIIKLTADISHDQKIVIAAAPKLTIDFNGHTLATRLTLQNYVGESSTASKQFVNSEINLVDYSKDKGGIIDGSNNDDCGILVYGQSNATADFDININNITIKGLNYGLVTNGLAFNKGVDIEAYNMKSIATLEATTPDSAGAYLPAKFDYEFTNCTFEGHTGYYAKSGNHELTNCTIRGTSTTSADPAYYNNGFIPTGSALVVDSSAGYQAPMNIEIEGGRFSSVSKHAIEEIKTAGSSVTPVDYAVIEIEVAPQYSVPQGTEAVVTL